MRIFIAFLTLTLGVAQSAFAQDSPDVVYQNSLLARSLSASDQAICEAKAGAGTPGFEACRVTRLFLADINAGRDKGVPPMAHIKYAVDVAEKNKILERL